MGPLEGGMTPSNLIASLLDDKSYFRGFFLHDDPEDSRRKLIGLPGWLRDHRVHWNGSTDIGVVSIVGCQLDGGQALCTATFLFVRLKNFSVLDLSNIVSYFSGVAFTPDDLLTDVQGSIFTLDARAEARRVGVSQQDLAAVFSALWKAEKGLKRKGEGA